MNITLIGCLSQEVTKHLREKENRDECLAQQLRLCLGCIGLSPRCTLNSSFLLMCTQAAGDGNVSTTWILTSTCEIQMIPGLPSSGYCSHWEVNQLDGSSLSESLNLSLTVCIMSYLSINKK